MDIQLRRQRRLVNHQNQENANLFKGKSNVVKRQGLAARGVLGDLNTNAQAQRDIAIGKVAVATAEHKKVNHQNQENANVFKGKSNAVKRQGLAARGVLGDLNTNAQAQRDIAIGKVAVATAEHKKVNHQNQENANVFKGKSNAVKRQGLAARGVLGDLNTNAQAQHDIAIGKVAVATAEHKKKATVSRATVKSSYSHVRPRIDTGLAAAKPVIPVKPSSRPQLTQEESTAALSAKAAAGTEVLKKTPQNKTNDEKILQPRKSKDFKKSSRLSVNEEANPVLKAPTESLGKLKLEESSKKDLLEEEHPPLPTDVEDIDAGDNSPLLMSCYIKDIYHHLTELELKYPIEPDHLKKSCVITGDMRATLIDWLVEVQHEFSLTLETFHLTVGILDRYLQAVPNVQCDQLQLVGVTAMFLASKYEEIYPPELDDFVYVTENTYNKAAVFQCEIDIMAKLGFCLARPTPLCFIRRFVKAADGTSNNYHLAKYLVDLCLVEYSMAHYRPSELAAAAVCLSLYLLSRKSLEEVWTPTMTYHSKYTLESLDPIIRKIAKIVVNVKNSKHMNVYKVYLDPTLAKVSALPELKGKAIQKLATKPSMNWLKV